MGGKNRVIFRVLRISSAGVGNFKKFPHFGGIFLALR